MVTSQYVAKSERAPMWLQNDNPKGDAKRICILSSQPRP
jgi:hypothetical protein